MDDTVNTSALSVSNFGTEGGTVTVSGLPAYTLHWNTNFQFGYGVGPYPIANNSGCASILDAAGTIPVVTSITLPNGEGSYQFLYDSTYGRVSQITYPSGGWIKYTWGLTDTLSESAVYANSSGVDQACQYQMYAPVVRERQVSFDGQNVAMTQTFTYSTVWNSQIPFEWTSKTTTVTTTDNLRNQTFTTTYSYSPMYARRRRTRQAPWHSNWLLETPLLTTTGMEAPSES